MLHTGATELGVLYAHLKPSVWIMSRQNVDFTQLVFEPYFINGSSNIRMPLLPTRVMEPNAQGCTIAHPIFEPGVKNRQIFCKQRFSSIKKIAHRIFHGFTSASSKFYISFLKTHFL